MADLDPVKYIQDKLCPNAISTTLLPVLIFQYEDNGAMRPSSVPQKIYSYLSGSGTMVTLPNVKSTIITVEHLFSVHHKANQTCRKFMVQVLREKTNMITRDLVCASPFFAGKPGLIDLAVCDVSLTGGRQDIFPFSQCHSGDDHVDRTKTDFNMCNGNPEDLIIRSLVSGQEATLMCMVEIPNTNGLRFYVVDCKSIPGESGTGFVDRHGKLFILMGAIVEGVDAFNQHFKRFGKIKKDRQHYSIVIGSLSVNGK